jgi:hypothetical protein
MKGVGIGEIRGPLRDLGRGRGRNYVHEAAEKCVFATCGAGSKSSANSKDGAWEMGSKKY